MPGEGHQKLTIEAEGKGFDATAKEVDKVSGATEDLGKKTKEQVKDTEASKEATDKLKASEEDLLGLLRSIHPALGGFAEGMLRASTVAGDLSSRQINLNELVDKGKKLVAEHSKVLSLVGAGGAVVAGILAIAEAFKAMATEARAAATAMETVISAQNALAEARAATQADVERMAAGRAEGPLSDEESATIADTVARLSQTATGISVSDDARRRAALLAGPAASIERLERLAILADRFPERMDADRLLGMAPDRRGASLERILARNVEVLDDIRKTEEQQLENIVKAARGELGAQGGRTYYLQKFIEALPGQGFAGADTAALARS